MYWRKIAVVFTVCILFVLSLSGGLVSAQGPGGTPPPPPPGQGQGSGGGGGGQQPPGGQGGQAPTFDESYQPVASTYQGIGTVTMGAGMSLGDFSLTPDCNPVADRFVAALTGLVTADDGSEWIVPMETHTGAGAVDIYNSCEGGDNADFMNELQSVVVNEDGKEVTGYLFGDNYFELYINGEFIGRDTIGFVPFNSSAVRFQATYPMTFVVRLADWETHPGIGMEYDEYKIGDGGFIATFSNGVDTGAEWKCQPFYIAPLDDPGCVAEDAEGNRDSSACSGNPQCATSNAEACRALHYDVPDNWMMPEFDDSAWLSATLYRAEEVTNQAGYSNYAQLFGDADFIWSQNLNLDNQVICRLTVDAPAQ